MKTQGLHYILSGFILLLFGVVAPLLMVIGVLRITFWLSILAYSASVVGFFLGVFGACEINLKK